MTPEEAYRQICDTRGQIIAQFEKQIANSDKALLELFAEFRSAALRDRALLSRAVGDRDYVVRVLRELQEQKEVKPAAPKMSEFAVAYVSPPHKAEYAPPALMQPKSLRRSLADALHRFADWLAA